MALPQVTGKQEVLGSSLSRTRDQRQSSSWGSGDGTGWVRGADSFDGRGADGRGAGRAGGWGEGSEESPRH